MDILAEHLSQVAFLHANANKLFGIKTSCTVDTFYQMCLFFVAAEPSAATTLTTIKPRTRKYAIDVHQLISVFFIFICVSIRKTK